MSDDDRDRELPRRRPTPGGRRMREELLRSRDDGRDAGAKQGGRTRRVVQPAIARGDLEAGAQPPAAPDRSATRRHRAPSALGGTLSLSRSQARNPYVAHSSELVALVSRLGMLDEVDVHTEAALRARASELVKSFRRQLTDEWLPRSDADDAVFCLCAYADHAIIASRWGARSAWTTRRLSEEFFGDVDVGGRLRGIADLAVRDPGARSELCEFLLLLLALGLAGEGVDHERYKSDLARGLEGTELPGRHALSGDCRGVARPAQGLRRIPPWVFAAGCVLVLLVAFLSIRASVTARAEPLLAQVGTIGFERLRAPALPAPLAPSRAEVPRLPELLADDLAAGVLALEEGRYADTLSLTAPGLFPSGSARPAPEFVPLLERIARAFGRLSGTVRVVGHTDDVPVRSVRFASNTELSDARARAVAEFLIRLAPGIYTTAVGRGPAEPLCREPTAACRARNRRVEIVFEQG